MQTKQILKNTKEIYTQFEIPINLQEHMYKVTAVAQLILENWKGEFKNKNELLAACLLHDLGNIIKIAKSDGNPLNQKEDVKKITVNKEKILKKWSADPHIATLKMAERINAPKSIMHILKHRELRDVKNVLKLDDDAITICLYADLRVSPAGIVSLTERFKDAKKRYPNIKDWDVLQEDAKKLESQLFKKIKIKPSQITNKTIKPFLNNWLK